MYRLITLTASFFLVSLPVFAQRSDAVQMRGEGLQPVLITTEEGVFAVRERVNSVVEAPVSEAVFMPDWQAHDDVAIPRCVAIDNLFLRGGRVWGAWTLNGPRLNGYPIHGDGTPDFEFPVGGGSRWCVVTAKGAGRILYGGGRNLYSFTSESGGVPDWTYTFPPGVTVSRNFTISYDGSTAAVVSQENTDNGFVHNVYLFDAETGDITDLNHSWTAPVAGGSVELTDNGSLLLVSEYGVATVLNTQTGNVVFQTSGSGAGDDFTLRYKISKDGSVLVIGGFDLEVYLFDKPNGVYERIIEFSLPNINWFGKASNVSRDGSTVGALTRIDGSQSMEVEAFLFDVKTAELIGSYRPPPGTQGVGTPQGAASNNDGTVWAFVSRGTLDEAWPEIMVFNRDVELIGEIGHPGVGMSVDVSPDGRFVAATFANRTTVPVPGLLGGDIHLMDLMPGSVVSASGVSAQVSAEVLSAPSPNPAHKTSEFTVAVEREQTVTIEVFDAMGRRVQTLFNGVLAASVSERLTLDASALPVGRYVIRVTGEDFTETQNVTVVR